MIERILVIDCDSYSLRFARQTLEGAGYEVITALDAQSGLRAAVSERPDLIVLNGALIVGQHPLRHRLSGNPRTADIPLILLAPRSAVEVGWVSDEYLFQPYDAEQLLERIAQFTFEGPRSSALISTGLDALDEGLKGGIPPGSLTLIEGEIDSGKSTLTRQVIWEALQGGLIVTLFSSEDTVRSLVTQMRRVGQDSLDFLLRGRISVYPLDLGRLGAHALQTLLQAMKWGIRRKVTVVDSLSPALAHSSAGEVHRFLEECKELCQGGSTVILVLHSYQMTDDLAESVRSLCDVHLKLRPDEQRRGRAAIVEICQVQGQIAAPGTSVPFEIEPERARLDVPARRSNGRRMAG